MKLFYAPPSPYARRCRVMARELGLMDSIEEVFAMPYDNPEELLTTNPLAKIPALTEADGTNWYDSAVINRRFLEVAGKKDAWPDLRGMQIEVLVTGITDAAFWIVSENRRTDTDKPSATWITRWTSAIERGVKELESSAAELEGDFDIPTIGAAVALGYLDFRLPDHEWRTSCPKLSAWYEGVSKRTSMQETRPDIS